MRAIKKTTSFILSINLLSLNAADNLLKKPTVNLLKKKKEQSMLNWPETRKWPGFFSQS
jgi:hypothetical protein